MPNPAASSASATRPPRVARGWVLSGRLGLRWAVLVGAVLFAYWPALTGRWIWQDASAIPNAALLGRPEGWRLAWVMPTEQGYSPLVTAIRWSQWHAWGAASMVGYHLTNLAVHLGNAGLLWRLFRRLGVRLPWLGALLFAVHPLAVDAIAWISGLDVALALLLALVAVDAWLTFVEGDRGRPVIVAVLAYAGAVLSHPAALVLPVVLALLLCWRGAARRHWLALLPVLLVAAVLGPVVLAAAPAGSELWGGAASGDSTRLGTSAACLLFYLGKSLYPVDLAPFYAPLPASPLLWFGLVGLGFAALAGCAARAWASWGRHVLLGAGWFLLSLAPALALTRPADVQLAPVADRFAYAALVAVAGLVAVGIDRVRRPLTMGPNTLVLVGAGAGVLWCGSAARHHARHFTSADAFWSYASDQNPQSWLPLDQVGTLALRRGDWAVAADRLRHELLFRSNDARVHLNLGTALMRLGRFYDALTELRTAARLDPRNAEARVALGDGLSAVSAFDVAVTEYRQAARLIPEPGPEMESNWGNALLRSGRPAEARPHFEASLRRQPGRPEAELGLGLALVATGRGAAAVPHLALAVGALPQSYEAQSAFAAALADSHRLEEAVVQYQAAIALLPHEPEAHLGRGEALLQLGRDAEAAGEFEHVLRLQPRSAAAATGLARARAAVPANRPR